MDSAINTATKYTITHRPDSLDLRDLSEPEDWDIRYKLPKFLMGLKTISLT